MENDYKTYSEWKNWGAGREIKPWQCRYFELEVGRANLTKFDAVLEIGFGNGEFLQWAKGRGAAVVGVEIIPEMVRAAAEMGFEVYDHNIVEQSGTDPLSGKLFDCIVAFDVMEHLPLEEAKIALRRMAALLAPGGKILLRFPNGESPFYVPIQNGDYTHRMDLCRVKLEHLCIGSGVELEGYYNAARVAGNRRRAWLKWIIFRVRDFIEVAIGGLYYNQRRPLDPVATAVLKKVK